MRKKRDTDLMLPEYEWTENDLMENDLMSKVYLRLGLRPVMGVI